MIALYLIGGLIVAYLALGFSSCGPRECLSLLFGPLIASCKEDGWCEAIIGLVIGIGLLAPFVVVAIYLLVGLVMTIVPSG